ncbi:MAG: hypothetical protein HKN31_06225 [Pricia sp.]|nr:hypothetical protein [Pricia sp.]
MKYTLLTFFFFGIITSLHSHETTAVGKKSYTKKYYSNGSLQAEGWVMGTMKMGYWKLYHPNGKLAAKGHFSKNKKDQYWHYYNTLGDIIKEGHYRNDSAEDWWIFYEPENSEKLKIQYRENRRHGYAMRYKKRKLVKVERFDNNEKTGEWTSVIAFKIDNPGVTW